MSKEKEEENKITEFLNRQLFTANLQSMGYTKEDLKTILGQSLEDFVLEPLKEKKK